MGQNTGLSFDRIVTLQHPGCLSEAIIMHELLHTLGSNELNVLLNSEFGTNENEMRITKTSEYV